MRLTYFRSPASKVLFPRIHSSAWCRASILTEPLASLAVDSTILPNSLAMTRLATLSLRSALISTGESTYASQSVGLS